MPEQEPDRRADHALVVIGIREQRDQRHRRDDGRDHRARRLRRGCDTAAPSSGSARRSRMNETICRTYASTAPNTAMLSSTAPTGPPCGVR